MKGLWYEFKGNGDVEPIDAEAHVDPAIEKFEGMLSSAGFEALGAFGQQHLAIGAAVWRHTNGVKYVVDVGINGTTVMFCICYGGRDLIRFLRDWTAELLLAEGVLQ